MKMVKLIDWDAVAELIAGQTEDNDHSGAVVTLTAVARLALMGTDRAKAAEAAADTAMEVKRQHEKQTYLTLNLRAMREGAYGAAIAALDGMISDQDLQQIKEAF